MTKRTASLLLLIAAVVGLVAAVWTQDGPGQSLPPAERDVEGPATSPTLVGARPPHTDASTAGTETAPAAPLPEDGWRLSGRILTVEGDSPIPGAQVRALWIEGARSELLAEGPSDTQGAFALPLPALATMSPARRAGGEVEVHATARGFGPSRGTKRETLPGLVRLRATSRDLTCTVRLIPGRTLSGSVVRADGRPLIGARVRAVPENPQLAWKTLSQTLVAPDSQFTLVVPSDAPVVLEIHAPGFGRTRHGPFAATPPHEDVGQITLSPPSTIEGLVVDGAGRPRPDVVVVGRRQVATSPPLAWSLLGSGVDEWNRETSTARSDARGHFVLPAAEPGARWTLTVTPQAPPSARRGQVLPGWRPLPRDTNGPGLVGGSPSREALAGDRDVLLHTQGTYLTAHVVDDTGVSIAGAEVALLGWPGAGSDSGRGRASPPRERLILESDESGHASTWVRTDSHWLVEAVLGPARGIAELDVFEGDWKRELELRVPDPEEQATLELRIDGDASAPLEKVGLWILTPGGRELLRREVSVNATLDVLPGPCRVHIEGWTQWSAPASRLDGGPVRVDDARPHPYAPHVEDIRLEPGRTHVLRTTLRRMAQLLVLLPQGDEADSAAGTREVALALQVGTTEREPVFVPMRTGLASWTVMLPAGPARLLVQSSWPAAASPKAPETDTHDITLAAGEIHTIDLRTP